MFGGAFFCFLVEHVPLFLSTLPFAEREIKIIEYPTSKERDGKLRHGCLVLPSPLYEEYY